MSDIRDINSPLPGEEEEDDSYALSDVDTEDDFTDPYSDLNDEETGLSDDD